MLFAGSESSLAQVSEVDSYERAVISQTKENALAFIEDFRSSHLTGDLIESLRPEVAREVCADLPGGVPRARRACEQLRKVPVAEARASARNAAASTAQSTTTAAPTQPIETQSTDGMGPAPAPTGAVAATPPVVSPEGEGQSKPGAPPTTAAGVGGTTDPAAAAAESAASSSALPQSAVATPPTPIKSRPVVYVGPHSGADILSQAADGSAIIGTASSNAPLTVLGRDRNWLKVLVPGMTNRAGWIHTSTLQMDAGGIKVVPAAGTTVPPLISDTSTTAAPATQVAINTAPAAAPSAMPPSATTAPVAADTAMAAGPVVRIWLSSRKSRELTEREWRMLQAAYGHLLANLTPIVRQVDLGPDTGGNWYRLYAGPLASTDEAQALCKKIKLQPPKRNCLLVVE